MRRIGFLIWKELIELRQDPRLFGIVILAPILQLFLLGYAATTDVRDVPIVVADADRSAASRDLIARFDGVAELHASSPSSASTDEIDPYLERGRGVDGAGDSAPATATTLDAGGRRRCRSIADGSDANSTNVALGYATNLIAGYAQEIGARRGVPAGGPPTRRRSSRASASGSTRGSRAATS